MLTLRSSIKWIFFVILTRTFLSCLFFSLKYMNNTAYWSVKCLLTSNFRTTIEVVIVRIESRFLICALKNLIFERIISGSKFTQSDVDEEFSVKFNSIVTNYQFLKLYSVSICWIKFIFKCEIKSLKKSFLTVSLIEKTIFEFFLKDLHDAFCTQMIMKNVIKWKVCLAKATWNIQRHRNIDVDFFTIRFAFLAIWVKIFEIFEMMIILHIATLLLFGILFVHKKNFDFFLVSVFIIFNLIFDFVSFFFARSASVFFAFIISFVFIIFIKFAIIWLLFFDFDDYFQTRFFASSTILIIIKINIVRFVK